MKKRLDRIVSKGEGKEARISKQIKITNKK